MAGFPTVPPVVLVIGGAFVLTILVAQVLIGYRKISLKGKTFLKVHKSVAWVLLAAAALHGVGGIVFVLSLR